MNPRQLTLHQKIGHLLELTSGQYIAGSGLEFIGSASNEHGAGARAVALQCERSVTAARAHGNTALKILMNGSPGIGKSGIALYLRRLLGCDKWSTTKLNGTQVKMDKLDEIEAQLHYKSLFGDYRLVQIEEADEIPRVAQVRLLTMLDDLPKGVAIICTSNCKVSDFEVRFQSRFQVFDLLPPTSAEIEALLCDYVPAKDARNIATFCCGNVRSALLDALGMCQAQPTSALALA